MGNYKLGADSHDRQITNQGDCGHRPFVSERSGKSPIREGLQCVVEKGP